MAELLDDFVRLFELPAAMIPYIDYVATDLEMRLVVGMNGQSMTTAQIAELMGMPIEEAEAFVKQCYTRCIVLKVQGQPPKYGPETFYRRLDPISMYEKWGDVPAEVRQEVIHWQLQEFIDKWTPAIEEIQRNPDANVRMPNRDILLLSEALEIVDAATDHAVALCDCRTITMACERPVEACIRLNEHAKESVERGLARPLSKDECHQLVVKLDRQGLMHTGDRKEKVDPFGFCSCCACDCYPFRAGIALSMSQQWPRSHYVAVFDREKCNSCGLCARRCQFGAFHLDGNTVMVKGHELKCVDLDPERCWGCGLCYTACTKGAITMKPLAEPAPAEVTSESSMQG